MWSTLPMTVNTHADFSFLMNHDVIAIIDENKGNKSVTNDIEYVLDMINKNYENLVNPPLKFKGIHCYTIIYKDSLGNWDIVDVNTENKFMGFHPIIKGQEIKDINEAFAAVSNKAIAI